MSYLIIRSLHKSYGATPIFSDIHCEIEKGEFVTLLGPSGCGKSTLLRALAGLTPVDGGQVRVAGEDITWQAPQKRGIGMVFQSYALFPNMTVWDNVAFGLRVERVAQYVAEHHEHQHGDGKRRSGIEQDRLTLAQQLLAGGDVDTP